MEDIFEIKFPIESEIKDNVITKFSSKPGGAFAIFSYYWQCFVWAASIGFLRNERRPLARPTERIFTLNTIRNNGGEKDAQALICMCIARFGSLEIMKHPEFSQFCDSISIEEGEGPIIEMAKYNFLSV